MPSRTQGVNSPEIEEIVTCYKKKNKIVTNHLFGKIFRCFILHSRLIVIYKTSIYNLKINI